VTQSGASNKHNQAQRNIDGHLELQELSNVVKDSSAPFNSSMNRNEIVVKNNQVRLIFGNLAA